MILQVFDTPIRIRSYCQSFTSMFFFFMHAFSGLKYVWQHSYSQIMSFSHVKMMMIILCKRLLIVSISQISTTHSYLRIVSFMYAHTMIHQTKADTVVLSGPLTTSTYKINCHNRTNYFWKMHKFLIKQNFWDN